jgi:hypothetical protein
MLNNLPVTLKSLMVGFLTMSDEVSVGLVLYLERAAALDRLQINCTSLSISEESLLSLLVSFQGSELIVNCTHLPKSACEVLILQLSSASSEIDSLSMNGLQVGVYKKRISHKQDEEGLCQLLRSLVDTFACQGTYNVVFTQRVSMDTQIHERACDTSWLDDRSPESHEPRSLFNV